MTQQTTRSQSSAAPGTARKRALAPGWRSLSQAQARGSVATHSAPPRPLFWLGTDTRPHDGTRPQERRGRGRGARPAKNSRGRDRRRRDRWASSRSSSAPATATATATTMAVPAAAAARAAAMRMWSTSRRRPCRPAAATSSTASAGSTHSPASPSSTASRSVTNAVAFFSSPSSICVLPRTPIRPNPFLGADLPVPYCCSIQVADVKRANGLTTDLQMFAHKTLRVPLHGRHAPSPPSSSPSHAARFILSLSLSLPRTHDHHNS